MWCEQQAVMISDGIINAHLGFVEPFPSDLFENDQLYLEVTIFNPDTDENETLSPRRQLTSTAFSIQAGNAEKLGGQSSSYYATANHSHNFNNIEGVISDHQVPDNITVDHANTAYSASISGNADKVDGVHAADLEESAEIDGDIVIHSAIQNAHHAKTTSFTELTDMAIDAQIPNNITVNHATTSGDADTVDGKHASELGGGDGYSLDAADGSPVDAVYVDDNGKVGIGTTNPGQKLTVAGTIESTSGGVKFPDGTIQTSAGILRTFDTGWFSVANNQSYYKTHNLGTDKLFIMIWAKDSSGTHIGMPRPFEMDKWDSLFGIYITDLTSNNFYVSTKNVSSSVYDHNHRCYTVTHARVLALAIE